MTPDQFKKAISLTGLTNVQAASLLCVSDRTVRSWLSGSRKMPACCVELWFMKQDPGYYWPMATDKDLESI